MPIQQIQGQDTEYKPWGLTAGAMVGERQADQSAMNLQALQESQLGNTIKGIEAARAQNDFNSPEMEALRQQGIMGKDKTSAAKGFVDFGGMQSDLGAKLAKNAENISADNVKQIINDTDMIGAVASSYGPAGLAQVLPRLSPQLQQIYQQVGPAHFVETMRSLGDNLKTRIADSAANRGTIAVNAAHEQAKMPAKGMEVAADLYGKIYSADAHLKAALASAAAHSNSADKARSLEQSATLEFERAQKAKTPEEAKKHMDNYTTLITAAEKLKTAAVTVKDTGETARMNTFMSGGKAGGPKVERNANGAIVLK